MINIRGVGRVRRAAKRIANRFVSRAIILLYHRVNELASDPQLLCVSRKHFSEHLEILRLHCDPVPLNRLSHTLASGSRGRCSVIVTFDDGYADNLHHAKPLLQSHDVPATVFIATGHIGSPVGFWKDVLEGVFLQPGTLPRTLRLTIAGLEHRWELGDVAEYTVDAFQRHRTWNVTKRDDPTARQYLYRCLSQILRPLSERERWDVLRAIASWAGKDLTKASVHRALSKAEVAQLAEGGIIEIGAHTVSHPILSMLSADEQRKEIQHSKDQLEMILERRISSFAYPYGGRTHYNSDTVSAVRSSGFEIACSNFEGAVRRGTDMWQLPRFLVRDCDGEEFTRHLRQWMLS